MQMRAGRPLPIVMLENNKGKVITSNKAFMGQKTVLYFWSQTQMNHFKRNEERANYTKKSFLIIDLLGFQSNLIINL